MPGGTPGSEGVPPGSPNPEHIDLSRIPVNKGTHSRLGRTKYSDLYETVHPSLVLISLCLLTGA